jgi:outer membrane protein assembly factor BamB
MKFVRLCVTARAALVFVVLAAPVVARAQYGWHLPRIANVAIAGGVVPADHRLLSVPADGHRSDLYTFDDNSGRQKWEFRLSPDGRSYNILIGGGVEGGRRFLSVTDDGSRVDIYDHDDNSGRQRWLVEPIGGDLVHIRIAGGILNDRRLLSVTADGSKVDLWNVDDNSGRQKWQIIPLEAPRGQPGLPVAQAYAPPPPYYAPPPRQERPFWAERINNIQIAGGVVPADHALLSVPADGHRSDLYRFDDNSGRQKWRFQRSPDGQSWNILIGGGVEGGRQFLSVTDDGSKVDIYDHDDNSGRQRWIVEPLGGDLFRIRIAGGILNDRRYLSVTADGSKVDLWNVDDESGRQKWRIIPR